MKPFALLLVLGCTAACSLQSASPAASGSLSPTELAAGWILLFDGESTFGWTPRGETQWEVVEGALHPAAKAVGTTLATTSEFADCELSLGFRLEGTADWRLYLRCPPAGEVSASTGTAFNLTRLAQAAEPLPAAADGWHALQITYQGEQFNAVLDGQPLGQARERRRALGGVALQRVAGQGDARFRNVKLRPLGLASIFNGKDLTGWKVIPDHKSVYAVTPEGWLNVRNGNGDIQTEKSYGNFVLQLDIISNGSHLNSGVFFRALPGQFWQGYESQIRNEWEGTDRNKPVDFGTGGIYLRQPARRVVADDRTWFTKTILAQGPHLAVWVNGFQVSDWTDTRAPHENPREGYRAQPGVISLQGHDPTTDLSFRNLRITELPAAAGGPAR